MSSQSTKDVKHPQAEADTMDLLAQFQRGDDDLVAIDKDEFLPGLPLPTDLFVRMPTGKAIMIAKRGAKSSLQDLHVSQSNTVTTFYVRREDYYAAVDQNLKIVSVLVQRREIPISKKAAFVKTAAHSVFIELDHLGLSESTLAHSRAAVQAVTTLVQSREDYLELVESLKQLPGNIIKTAVAGSALSVVIAKEMGWQNGANLEKLALCAFLRDVGLKEIPPEILEKPRARMTQDERAIWETHCFRGAEILRQLPGMPSEVIATALEHHENAIGQGFPRRIRDMKMNPFAKIVALADLYIDLTFPSPGNDGMSMHEAMQHIEFVLGSPYNKACMVALKRSFNIQTSKPEEAEAAEETIPENTNPGKKIA
ncbi:MAG: HD domain-containing protein [Bdellovibrionaceae bacterium]|nr:HD domain-containing protein [Pseudobdellovibrionaceae bacterium]